MMKLVIATIYCACPCWCRRVVLSRSSCLSTVREIIKRQKQWMTHVKRNESTTSVVLRILPISCAQCKARGLHKHNNIIQIYSSCRSLSLENTWHYLLQPDFNLLFKQRIFEAGSTFYTNPKLSESYWSLADDVVVDISQAVMVLSADVHIAMSEIYGTPLTIYARLYRKLEYLMISCELITTTQLYHGTNNLRMEDSRYRMLCADWRYDGGLLHC